MSQASHPPQGTSKTAPSSIGKCDEESHAPWVSQFLVQGLGQTLPHLTRQIAACQQACTSVNSLRCHPVQVKTHQLPCPCTIETRPVLHQLATDGAMLHAGIDSLQSPNQAHIGADGPSQGLGLGFLLSISQSCRSPASLLQVPRWSRGPCHSPDCSRASHSLPQPACTNASLRTSNASLCIGSILAKAAHQPPC